MKHIGQSLHAYSTHITQSLGNNDIGLYAFELVQIQLVLSGVISQIASYMLIDLMVENEHVARRISPGLVV